MLRRIQYGVNNSYNLMRIFAGFIFAVAIETEMYSKECVKLISIMENIKHLQRCGKSIAVRGKIADRIR